MNTVPFTTVAIAAFSLVVSLLPGAAGWLQWDRHAFAHGEFWRVITGHAVHFGAEHLSWDLLVFLLLGGIAESSLLATQGRVGRRHFVAVLLLAAVTISAALFVAQPDLLRYRGLSGLDSALFGWIAIDLALRAWRARHGVLLSLCGLALSGFAAKSIYEMNTGRAVFVANEADAFVPVPLAHVIGMLVGAVSAWRPTGFVAAERSRCDNAGCDIRSDRASGIEPDSTERAAPQS